MALVIGTNAGFVISAPTGDPEGGTAFTMDNTARAMLVTSPATAVRITEIGWYTGTATEEANFEVGLYNDDAGSAGDMLESDTVNAKGTSAGWKIVSGLSWSITELTDYWIAVQLDDTATLTTIDAESGITGTTYEYLTSVSALADPFGGGSGLADTALAIYAVWEAAGGGGIPIAVFMHHYKQLRNQ